MKKQFFLMLSCVIFMQTLQNYGSQEEIIDLVICNDGMDIVYPNVGSWLAIDEDSGAVLIDIFQALLEKQLVLCTKSLWISMQNLVQIWENFVNKSEEELIEEFKNNSSGNEEDEFYDEEEIKFQKNLIVEINNKYNTLQQQLDQIPDPLKKYQKAQQLSKELDSEEYNSDKLASIIELFNIYIGYKVILAHQYTCKTVTYNKNDDSDYLLFIPKNFVTNFNWNNLIDYNYSKFISSDVNNNYLFSFAQNAYEIGLGQNLLKTLKTLMSQKSKNIQIGPFFNILITGHGDKDNVAEISIKIKDDQKKSDFLQILDYFQYFMYVKSLAIMACFPGGQKINSAFVISNQWNNINLEKLSYPIIYIGSFFATILGIFSDELFMFGEDKSVLYTDKYLYGPAGSFANHMYKNYFKYLHEKPINYEDAARVISGVDFKNEKMKKEWLQNFVMIRYPNTSWFTPVDLKTDTKNLQFAQKISQIQALTNPVIKISSQTKIVKLEANVIDSIKCEVNNLDLVPDFLPLMQNNQNYVINHVEFPNIKLGNKSAEMIYQAIMHFLPISKIEEPVNVVIKELKFTNARIKNIYTFTQKTFDVGDFSSLDPAEIQTGYVFTDQNNKTKILTWNQKPNYEDDENYEDEAPDFDPHDYKDFGLNQLQGLIKEIENKARKNLQDFSELEKKLKDKTGGNKPHIFIQPTLLPDNNINKSNIEKIERLAEVLSLIQDATKSGVDQDRQMILETKKTADTVIKNIVKEEKQNDLNIDVQKIIRIVKTLQRIEDVNLANQF